MVFWVGGLLIELLAWVVEVDEKEDIFSFIPWKEIDERFNEKLVDLREFNGWKRIRKIVFSSLMIWCTYTGISTHSRVD